EEPILRRKKYEPRQYHLEAELQSVDKVTKKSSEKIEKVTETSSSEELEALHSEEDFRESIGLEMM
ncbi:hypothetical protein NPIL_163661, partial [Nephila pilipes]